MKNIFKLLLAATAFFLSSFFTSAMEPKPIDSLMVVTSSGWILEVNRDGSGRLQFGSGPIDAAILGKGSCDFIAVTSALSEAIKGPTASGAVSVAFSKLGDTSVVSTPLSRQEVGFELLKILADKAKPLDKVRFNELRNSHPFDKGVGTRSAPPSGKAVGAAITQAHPDFQRASKTLLDFCGKFTPPTTAVPSPIFTVNSLVLGDLFPQWRFYRASCTVNGGPQPSSTTVLSVTIAVSDTEAILMSSNDDSKEFTEFLRNRSVRLTDDTVAQ